MTFLFGKAYLWEAKKIHFQEIVQLFGIPVGCFGFKIPWVEPNDFHILGGVVSQVMVVEKLRKIPSRCGIFLL